MELRTQSFTDLRPLSSKFQIYSFYALSDKPFPPREAFAIQDGDQKPAHIFLRSVHHIPIERGWLDLRQDFGHNFPHFWYAGSKVYKEDDLKHR